MQDSTRDFESLLSPSPPQPPRRFLLEATRVAGIGAALGVFLALFSHASSDPSLTTFSTSGSVQNWMGRAGAILSDLLFQLVGVAAFMVPLVGARMAWRLGRTDSQGPSGLRWVAVALLIVGVSGFSEQFIAMGVSIFSVPHAGGVVGVGWSWALSFLLGPKGAKLVTSLVCIVAFILVFEWSGLDGIVVKSRTAIITLLKMLLKYFRSFGTRLWSRVSIRKYRHDKAMADPELASLPEPLEESEGGVGDAPPIEASIQPITIGQRHRPKFTKSVAQGIRRIGRDFKLPPLSLLSGKAESKPKAVDKNWYLEKSQILIQKLKDFGVDGEVSHISPGPVITVYEFKPASGVKIKEIASLSDDLTLALSVLSVRIVAPIPGKPVVGIEIPSPHREMVFFKDLLNETPFFKSDLKIPLALGRLASGEPIAADLASMPHLLIAGTTGTGKSVFINTLILSLLYRFTPKELKLILVDPKMVELSLYEDIPHLLLPVVVDSRKAALALRWTVDEMERRYTLLHQLGVRHIDAYNERLLEFQKAGNAKELSYMPFIVVVIDEYADLMAVVPKDVELSIARLAQKARASGIHLVLATQRPSTDVVTGTIKANFPSRISFRVASSIDSKTILDRAGAERLLGHGDLLFHSAGFTSLRRMQGSFVSDHDIAEVVSHLKTQAAPEYDEWILQAQESLEEPAIAEETAQDNELYDRALRLVTEKGEASISLIQRHLRIGYNRAAMLMEELEKNGVVAQPSGNAKRRAIIPQAI